VSFIRKNACGVCVRWCVCGVVVSLALLCGHLAGESRKERARGISIPVMTSSAFSTPLEIMFMPMASPVALLKRRKSVLPAIPVLILTTRHDTHTTPTTHDAM
jgi:hypothetical protein